MNAYAAHSSQIDFPSWIHEQLEKGLSIEIEYENKIAKKMIMVALWCIQWMPVNRPSVTKILEMLESEGEALEMPLKPIFGPQEMPIEDLTDETDDQEISTQPHSATETTTASIVQGNCIAYLVF